MQKIIPNNYWITIIEEWKEDIEIEKYYIAELRTQYWWSFIKNIGYALHHADIHNTRLILSNWKKDIDIKMLLSNTPVKRWQRVMIDDEWAKIDWILINETEELYDYDIVPTSDEIDNLCMWISESESQSEIQLMKQDLQMLLKSEDDYILSSNQTNDYVDHTYGDIYNSHCDAILKLNPL